MSLPPTTRWLSLRIRVLCIVFLVLSSLIPPYIPEGLVAAQEYVVPSPQFLLVEDGFLMKSSPLTNRQSRMTFGQGIEHIVKDGDSIEKIARRYNITADTIRWANGIESYETIHPGDTLLILPVNGVLHSVRRGQTLNEIAELYDVDADRIIQQNGLEKGVVLVDQELIIPEGKPVVQPTVVEVAVAPDTAPSAPAPRPSEGTDIGSRIPPVITPRPPIVQPDVADTGALHKPCSAACFITQYFRAGHYALDMQERGGGPIFASEGGTVIRASYGWNGGYGNVIEIDHGNGLVTLYAHNKTLYVAEGDTVYRGQNIAHMGNSGLVYGPTGIHVHFEVQVNGIKKNPMLYLE